MLNIGYNPTVSSDNEKKNIEVHIFDFQENLYNNNITIYFKYKIRNEIEFKNIDLLKKQLLSDKKNILSLFGS